MRSVSASTRRRRLSRSTASAVASAASIATAGALALGMAGAAGADTIIDDRPETMTEVPLPLVHVARADGQDVEESESAAGEEAEASCTPGTYRTEITSLTRTYRHVGTSHTENRTAQAMPVSAHYSTNDVVDEKVTGDLGAQWPGLRSRISSSLEGDLHESLSFTKGATSGAYTLPAEHRGVVDYGYALVTARGTQQRCTFFHTWGFARDFSATAPWKRVATVTITNSATGEVSRPEAINPSGGTESPGEGEGYIDPGTPSES